MTAIPANVIFIWTGTNASIPSGWSRETTLDAKYPKGTAASVDPGGTGGALTHSHTTPAHNHTTAHVHTVPNDSGETGSSNRDAASTNPPAAHTHVSNPNTVNPTTTLANDTPSTDAVNHEPANMAVIFVKSDGTPTGLPDKMVGLWNSAAGAPTNWNLCDGGGTPARPDMRNRFVKGAATAGDGGGTGGGTTHTHSIVSHTHSTPYAHGHPDVVSSQTATALSTGSISGPNAGVATSIHTHSLTIGSASPAITGNTDSAASSNHEPPYWVLAWIQNNAGALDFPDRIIGIWLGTLATIPTNWKLCDGTNGTPDLRSLFVKGANTLAGIGGSGGSLTHGATHTATGHTHPVASHQHTVTDQGNGAGENRTAGATAAATTAHTHTFANSGAASFTSGSGTPVPDNYTDTQPPYVGVAFIQWQVAATQYNQSVSGALSTSGALTNQTIKSAFTGTLTTAGTLVKQTARSLAGTFSGAGVLATIREVLVTLTGSFSSSGTLANQTGKSLGGTLSTAGTLTKQAALNSLTGVLSTLGTLTKQMGRSLSGAFSSAGALSTSRVVLVTLSGALSTSGTLARSTLKSLSGVLSSAGALNKQTSRTVTGTFSTAGSLVRQTQRAVSGALTSAGELTRKTLRSLSGAFSPSGVLDAVLGGGTKFFQNVGGTLSTSGSLTKSTIKGAFTASLGLVGSLTTISSQIVRGFVQLIEKLFGNVTLEETDDATPDEGEDWIGDATLDEIQSDNVILREIP